MDLHSSTTNFQVAVRVDSAVDAGVDAERAVSVAHGDGAGELAVRRTAVPALLVHLHVARINEVPHEALSEGRPGAGFVGDGGAVHGYRVLVGELHL